MPIAILERSFYYGIIIMALLYGLEMYMFFHSFYLVLKRPPIARWTQVPYVVIGGLMLALVTIVVFTDVVFLEFMWIDHRDVEGGPIGYFLANSSIWWQTTGTLADQLTNFLGDGLLMYRLYIIWAGNAYILVLPTLFYLGSIATALVTTVQSALPGSNFFSGITVNFGVPWAALSVSLNVFCTCAIVFRLYQARQQMRKVLPDESLETYTGVIAMLVESSLPFSVLGIVFAVTYGKNLAVGPAFLFIWGTLCALSPQFIIYRVAAGHAWTPDVVSQMTRDISFANPAANLNLSDVSRVTETATSTSYVAGMGPFGKTMSTMKSHSTLA